MKNNSKKKIAIVGAGPAGLTAAESLKNKGYTDVTILEKNSQAGGKCFSIQHEGRSFELGAAIITGNNRTIIDLAKKYGVKMNRIDFSYDPFFLDIQTGKPLVEKHPSREKLFLFCQLFFIYRNFFLRHRKIDEPGFSHVDADICVPFAQWAADHHLALIEKWFVPFFTGFGYGYFDEIPTGYVLKYYSWEMLKAIAKKSLYNFPNGFQELWRTVAKNHHVLYDTVIKKVHRNQSVIVQTETKELPFDALILTSPLDEALHYLDGSEEEKNLFSKIISCDYRSYACFVKNFPQQNGYLPGNYTSSRKGHPVYWHQRYSDSNLYIFYVLGDWKMSDDEILKNIEKVVHQLGGTIEGLHTAVHWKYFPHVNAEEMRNGYFDKLENLQGKNHTYYAGELLNFSSTELSAVYAKKLVEKYF